MACLCLGMHSRPTFEKQQVSTARLAMTVARNQDGPCIELERYLPSEVTAISPVVDQLMLLIRQLPGRSGAGASRSTTCSRVRSTRI